MKLTILLNISEKQVSLRIGKWGGRKRLRKKEWIDAKTLIGQRKTIGKDTELVLNNSVIIAGKRLKKGLSRNHESFTDRVFREGEFLRPTRSIHILSRGYD